MTHPAPSEKIEVRNKTRDELLKRFILSFPDNAQIPKNAPENNVLRMMKMLNISFADQCDLPDSVGNLLKLCRVRLDLQAHGSAALNESKAPDVETLTACTIDSLLSHTVRYGKGEPQDKSPTQVESVLNPSFRPALA